VSRRVYSPRSRPNRGANIRIGYALLEDHVDRPIGSDLLRKGSIDACGAIAARRGSFVSVAESARAALYGRDFQGSYSYDHHQPITIGFSETIPTGSTFPATSVDTTRVYVFSSTDYAYITKGYVYIYGAITGTSAIRMIVYNAPTGTLYPTTLITASETVIITSRPGWVTCSFGSGFGLPAGAYGIGLQVTGATVNHSQTGTLGTIYQFIGLDAFGDGPMAVFSASSVVTGTTAIPIYISE
jgi:hypothetical protein